MRKASENRKAVAAPVAMTIARTGTVSLREGRARHGGQPDRDAREREDGAAPRVRNPEFEAQPRRYERDEETGPQADQPVEARELQQWPPVHPFRPGLPRAQGLAVAPQQDHEGDR